MQQGEGALDVGAVLEPGRVLLQVGQHRVVNQVSLLATSRNVEEAGGFALVEREGLGSRPACRKYLVRADAPSGDDAVKLEEPAARVVAADRHASL